MRFEFRLGPSDISRRRERGTVSRLLVLSDLRGNGAGPGDPLLERPIVTVDIDNLDDVLARHAAVIQLGAAAGGERLEIQRFDDLHPDALVESLSVFRRLRDVRARLEHPSTFAAAVADLQGTALAAAPIGGDSAPPPAAVEDDAATLDRLLGRTGTGRVPEAAVERSLHRIPDSLDSLIRQAVSPHIVPAPSPHLPQMLAAVDAAMTDLMRAVLHDPEFQRVEATWRAIQWLVSMLDLGESLELHLLHVTREELDAGAARDGDLWRRLVEREAEPGGGSYFSAVAGNFRFGASAGDVATLEQVGTLAADLGAPFIAEGLPSLLGATSLASQPDPREWAVPSDDDARWNGFRAHPAAAHVGLALPRFLLRLPYGPRTDPIAAFAFDEQPVRPEHDRFLWGNPSFACAVVIARALGTQEDSSAAGSIGGLPAFVSFRDDEPALQPAAEVGLTETAAAAIQARGLMPVVGFRNRGDIRLVPPHAVASTPTRLLE